MRRFFLSDSCRKRVFSFRFSCSKISDFITKKGLVMANFSLVIVPAKY